MGVIFFCWLNNYFKRQNKLLVIHQKYIKISDMISSIRKNLTKCVMELKNQVQRHCHPNRASEWSHQDITPSYSMWSGLSARSDRWSGLASCVFWPQAVNVEVPWLTVCCDNKHRLSVTAQIDWFPNLPRTPLSLIFLQTLYCPHLSLLNRSKLFSFNIWVFTYLLTK